MKTLLDSHVLIWFVTGNPRCSAAARRAIEAPDTVNFVSAASAWEIATKVRSGRWAEADIVVRDFGAAMAENGFSPLPVTIEHGRAAGLLEAEHRDPFDRMLAAQAMIDGLTLVTADPAFRSFDVPIVW